MQPRRIARELALLSIGQLSTTSAMTESQEIESAIIAAIRTLSEEVRDTLEQASADLNRSSERILESEIKAVDVNSARAMLQEAIALTQTSINRLGSAVDLPEFIQVAQSRDVKEFAFSIIKTCRTRRPELDEILEQSLVDWQLSRLAKIDRNILRIAVAEISILGIPNRVAINEAIELAKKYSTDDGHKFINGVLRRVTDHQKKKNTPASSASPSSPATPVTEDPTPVAESSATPMTESPAAPVVESTTIPVTESPTTD